MFSLLALDTGLQQTAQSAGYGTASGSITYVVGQAIRIGLGVIGLVFLFFVIQGGILWMTAQGDPEKVKKAQRLIMNSVFALLVIVGAYAISSYTIQALTQAVSQ